MASSFSQAHRIPDDIDWSVSHRTPPAPPIPNHSIAQHHHFPPQQQQLQQQQQQQQQHHHHLLPHPHQSPSLPSHGAIAAALTTDEPSARWEGVSATFRGDRPLGIRADAADHRYTGGAATVRLPTTATATNIITAPQETAARHIVHSSSASRSASTQRQQEHPSGRKSISGDQSVDRPSTSAGGAGGERRRRGSFNFLRRNSSHHNSYSNHSNAPYTSHDPALAYTSNVAPPPLPVTRIAQAHAEAAADPNNRHFRNGPETASINSKRKTSSEGAIKMLRKGSKMRAQQQQQQQAEQERLAREAAQVPRQPPHLPNLSPLPGIATFGGEESTSNGHAHQGSVQTRTANFSRPSAMSSSAYNASPSPNYPARAGSAVPSSPDVLPPTVGEYVPIGDQSESITHRGRYSYASTAAHVNSVNSPRRVRRRKDPTPFNVLVIGAKNSGKTSFINFLRHSFALPSHKQSPDPPQESQRVLDPKSPFTSHYLETEIDGERVGVTLWDSAGLEKNIVDLQLREMTTFVEARFEDTFVEEQKVMRSPGVRDTHIHCVFLMLDPVRLDSSIAASSAFQPGRLPPVSLDDHLDLQVMRALWGKTTIIPLISKADTLTVGHMAYLKRAVWKSLKSSRLDPLEALELEEDADDRDEDDSNSDDVDDDDDPIGQSATNDPVLSTAASKKLHQRQSSISLTIASSGADDETPYIPMSVLSPDLYDLPPYAPLPKPGSSSPATNKTGRRFPWGFADPLNPEHCDFGRLRDSIFSEWRHELRELSRTKWYENWRTSRLQNLPSPRQQQRVRGGVTPVTAVPKEGRRVGPPEHTTFGSRNPSGPPTRLTAPGENGAAVGTAVGERG